MTIEVRWGAASHVGRVRNLNEDAVLAAPPVFAVADGMGGHDAGEVAAAVAVAEFERFVGATALTPDSVLVAVRDANTEIFEHANRQGAGTVMGTTLAGVALAREGDADQVVAFNVGDSRVYRWRDSCFEQLSRDHSVVAELVRDGAVTDAEAKLHPDRHVVTRALGIAADVDVDRWAVDPVRGDRFVVCSDGLVNEVDDDAIAAHLARRQSAQETADALVAAALVGAARDNVSVIVVDVIDARTPTPGDLGDDTNPRLPAPGSRPGADAS